MSRRVLITSALIALLLGSVILAPGLPPVRAALLQRALRLAEGAGVSVHYDRADGNAWRRVELLNVSVQGHGADVSIERLELSYHLPSLLGAELPLSVAASGVQGQIDFSGLEDSLARSVNGGASARLPVRLVLREVDLQDVTLSSANAPFTIPDATITNMSVLPEPGALQLAATVATAHGEVSAEGRLSVPALEFAGNVTHGDVSVAQHWWAGATAGTFSGPFTFRRGQLNADVTISNAQVDEWDLAVTDIGGTASMRYPVITAELAGVGLGGPVAATGTVNVAALNYNARGTATPALQPTAQWLAEFMGATDLPLNASGQATVNATVSGWISAAVEANATASGTVAGLPLEDLSATFSLPQQGSMRGSATANLAGAPVSASLAPSSAGTRLEFAGAGLDLASLDLLNLAPGGVLDSLTGRLELAPTPNGTFAAQWRGDLAGYDATLDLDGQLDGDGLQAFLVAQAATPGAAPVSATGAVVFADQRLEAGVSVADLLVPGLGRPLRLGVTAQGPVSDLRLTATVENERPVPLDLAWFQASGALAASDPIDLRGSATARLVGGELTDIVGAFGPARLSGGVTLAPLAADFALVIEPWTLRVGSSAAAPAEPDPTGTQPEEPATPAPVRATLSMPGGRVTYQDGVLQVRGLTEVLDAAAGTVTTALESVSTEFTLELAQPEVDAGATWRFSASDVAGRARFDADSVSGSYGVTLAQLPVYLTGGGRPALLSGTLTPAPNGMLEVETQLAEGSAVAGLELQSGALMSGAISTLQQRLDLSGAVGSLPLYAAVDWSGGLVNVSATLQSPGSGEPQLALQLTPATGAWSMAGEAPLAPLLTELGVNGLEADFTGDLSFTPTTGYAGQGAISVAAPLPAELLLSGAGPQLNVAVSGQVGGVPLEGSGSVTEPLLDALAQAFSPGSTESPSLLVDVGPLRDLTLDVRGLRGAGQLGGAAFGPLLLEPVPWSLEFDWASTSGYLEASDEVLQVALRGGTVNATGSLAAAVTYAGAPYRLRVWPGAFPGAVVSQSALDNFPLGGQLAPAAGGAALASVAGTLDSLNVLLDARLEDVAAALPAGFQPSGHLTASATVNALNGPRYSGSLTLAPSGATPLLGGALAGDTVGDLRATFSGVGGAFALAVDGAGLELDRVPASGNTEGRLTLVADAADLGPFLPQDLSAILNGSLSYGAAGWRGRLTADLELAGDETTAAPAAQATAALVGAFDSLNLQVEGLAQGPTRFEAAGPVLPQPNVSGGFQLADSAVTGTFAWTDGVSATVISAAQQLAGIELPALAAELRFQPDTGVLTLVSLPDPSGGAPRTLDLQLAGGVLSGDLHVPLTVQGEPLAVSAELSGSLSDPQVQAQVLAALDAGGAWTPVATVEGTLQSGARLSATLPRELLGRLVPPAEAALGWVGPTAQIDADITPEGQWRAALLTDVAPTATAAGQRLALQAEASGPLASLTGGSDPEARYAGLVQLLAFGSQANSLTVAAAPFSGTGAAAEAELDLAQVEWSALGSALGTPFEVDGAGRLALSTQPFTAQLDVELEGRFGDNVVALSGSAPDGLRLALTGPATTLEGNLAWSRSLTGGGTALLSGHVAERPVNLSLVVDDGLASGSLDLEAVGSTLTARLETLEPGARQVSFEAAAPPGSLAAFGGDAQGTIALEGARAALTAFEANVSGLLGPADDATNGLSVHATGPLTPALHVTGLVTSPRLEESVVLSVSDAAARAALPATGPSDQTQPQDPGGVLAQLEWRDLTVTASPQEGGSVTLSGHAAHTDLQALLGAAAGTLSPGLISEVMAARLVLSTADLGWSAANGWRGSLAARAQTPWLPTLGGLNIAAAAEAGSLRLLAEADVQGGALQLTVVVPERPWTDAPLLGDLTVDLPSSALLPGLNVPLQVHSTALLEGTTRAPTVSGALLVSGAVTAQGSYGFVDGALHLSATGPELTVTGRVDEGGAAAEAEVRSLAVGAWLPQLPEAVLSLNARYAGAQVSLESIELTAPGSSLTGRATVGFGPLNGATETRFNAALSSTIDLADLALGDLELQGEVRGPVVISSASMSDLLSSNIVANLAALGVSTPALDWSVSGNLTLGGTLSDPQISSQFTGDGELRGLLTLNARPAAKEYSVSSTLAIGQLATDLRVDLGNGAAQAAGSVRVGDGVLVVAHQPGPDQTGADDAPGGAAQDLLVTGAGRFAGFGAHITGDLSAITVTGDLGRLGYPLEGRLSLTADAREETWLLGHVSGLTVGGYALEPISISSVALGAPVLVTSQDLRATLDPATLDWSLAVTDTSLTTGPEPARLSVWARGKGAVGTIDASVAGSDFDLNLEVRHDDDTSVLLEGGVYGGRLFMTGERDAATGSWSGGGTLEQASLAGFGVTAQATLLGVGLVPTLVLATTAENGLRVTGNASVGTEGVTLDQFVSGGPLQQTLRVQGRVLPRSDVTLSALDLPGGAPVTAADAARATVSSVRLSSLPALAPDLPASLRATGALSLALGPARLELGGSGTPPVLAASLTGLPRWRAETQLLAPDLLGAAVEVVRNGLVLEGRDDASGSVRLDPQGMRLELVGFGLEFAGMSLEGTGTLAVDEADVTGQLLVRTDLPVAERQTGYVFPWRLSTDQGIWRLVSDGPHGQLSVEYGAVEAAGTLALSADLQLSDGRIEGQLGLGSSGLAGTLSVSAVRLLSPELGTLTVDAEATVAEGRVGGSSTLSSEAGQVVVNGVWGLGGLLPAAVAPNAPSGGRLEARVRALELSDLPYLAERVPELHGQVTGTAQLRDGFLFGQLVSQEIGVGDLNTPMQLAMSGRPADLTIDLQLRGALGRANLRSGNLSGMFRFERFPLNLVSTAVVGPADFTADMTGVMRFDGPVSAPQDAYIRLATEEVRLERMGVTTLGNVTVTYDQRAVLVERAEFEGLGSWRAAGVLRQEQFDFQLEADRADFTPLLGLVPQFARLGVGAVGSFDLNVLGDLANPNITLTSPDLLVEVAGTGYRLEDTAIDLDGVTLTLESRVHGLRPVEGTLDVAGIALLSLFPFKLDGTDLALAGAAQLSTFGRLTDVTGNLRQQPDGTPTVQLVGTMGARPLTLEGTLAPLDVRASGAGVTARLPNLLVDSAVVDADLRLVSVEGGVALSGSIVADEVIVDPAARRAPAAPPAAEAPEGTDLEPLTDVEAPPAAQPQAARGGGLAALRFDDLVIRAPGRVTLTTNIGSFEAGLDLVLAGTGAAPRLAGNATAIRGNLRFGGRDFTIDRAVATFTPNRGVYPELDVVAHSEFDKQRVVAAAPNVSFSAPREGSNFEVQLAFFGPVEPTDNGGFRFDIQPILSSNALIEVESQSGGGSVTRPFTEAELMSLVTLGRFELNADFIGSGGLGGAVATGALDTAIDLLVVSGLESALREALGLDVVEIRTTSLSALIEDGQQFGVSLRVGGYLQPELFASYRIGTYDGSDPDFSITNEVMLRYGLGPLDLDIIGRIDLPAAGTAGQPRPELGAVLGYQFSPWLGIDGGVSISPVRSRIEFGVTFRW